MTSLSDSQECSSREFDAIPDTPDYVSPLALFPPESNKLYSESATRRMHIRWGNVRPLDSTRVKLDGPAAPEYVNDDFVEASWVNVGNDKRVIIASAPIQTQFHQWWATVFLKDVTDIFCLTRDVEKGCQKMDFYWRRNAGEVDNVVSYINTGYKVTTKSCDCLSDDLIRYTVKVEHGPETGYDSDGEYYERNTHVQKTTKIVRIYQYTGWPDFGVPENTSEVLQITKLLQSSLAENTGNIIIHCSAGRGRTGVVTAAVRCINTSETPAEAIANLRKERTGMVQTSSQYHFLKKLMTEFQCDCIEK